MRPVRKIFDALENQTEGSANMIYCKTEILVVVTVRLNY